MRAIFISCGFMGMMVMSAWKLLSESEPGSNTIINFAFPQLVEDSSITKVSLHSRWIEAGDYKPIFMGVKHTDSILIDYMRVLLRANFQDIRTLHQYAALDSWEADLHIIVDTSHKIACAENLLGVLSKAVPIYYEGYPVYIINQSENAIDVGFANDVNLIMEAKNREGEWKPIEEEFMYMCGNGSVDIILPPNEFLLTSAPVYTGNFETELRLRMDELHVSNSFKGTINETQFETYSSYKNNFIKTLPDNYPHRD